MPLRKLSPRTVHSLPQRQRQRTRVPWAIRRCPCAALPVTELIRHPALGALLQDDRQLAGNGLAVAALGVGHAALDQRLDYPRTNQNAMNSLTAVLALAIASLLRAAAITLAGRGAAAAVMTAWRQIFLFPHPLKDRKERKIGQNKPDFRGSSRQSFQSFRSFGGLKHSGSPCRRHCSSAPTR